MQLCLSTICCGRAFGGRAGQQLLHKHLEKTVMFEDENKINADIARDKKFMYRNHRLSREDKAMLYKIRPDLNLRNTEPEPVEEEVVVIDWEVNDCNDDEESVLSIQELNISNEENTADEEKKTIRNRPSTPVRRNKRNSDDHEHNTDQIQEKPSSPRKISNNKFTFSENQDNQNQIYSVHNNFQAIDEKSASEKWLENDPTEALLGNHANSSNYSDSASNQSSKSSRNTGTDDDSSSDESDDEDDELRSMIAGER
jgi:hypothetical protein